MKNLTWQNPEQLFVAQELINKVKSKCCGIKVHQNIAADITVSDIVKQVPLSRRLLEIRFKQVTQQSIHKYIFNLRMERFAQLLLASDAPIADVAEQVGINNLKNLSRQFKALKKVSPNEYRKEYQTKSYQR